MIEGFSLYVIQFPSNNSDDGDKKNSVLEVFEIMKYKKHNGIVWFCDF